MTTTSKPLAHAVACALGACVLVPLPVSALMITNTAVFFSDSANVTDVEGGGGTTINDASLGTSSISQFDPSRGVLMGTTLNLTSARTQTTQVTATAGTETNGSNGMVTSSGTGSSTAGITAPGVSAISRALAKTLYVKTTVVVPVRAPLVTSAASTTDLAAPAVGILDEYVGLREVLIERTALTLTAEQTNDEFNGYRVD